MLKRSLKKNMFQSTTWLVNSTEEAFMYITICTNMSRAHFEVDSVAFDFFYGNKNMAMPLTELHLANIPIRSMGLVYLPTFTIKINQMYLDLPMTTYKCTFFFVLVLKKSVRAPIHPPTTSKSATTFSWKSSTTASWPGPQLNLVFKAFCHSLR